MHHNDLHEMLGTIKRVEKTNKKQKRVAISPLYDINYCHQDDGGLAWEQGYQYAQIATCNSAVIKANYNLKLDITAKPIFAFKTH